MYRHVDLSSPYCHDKEGMYEVEGLSRVDLNEMALAAEP